MKEPYLDAFGRAMTVGARVRYVPNHAHGDCEIGVVTSWNEVAVFVRYAVPAPSENGEPRA